MSDFEHTDTAPAGDQMTSITEAPENPTIPGANPRSNETPRQKALRLMDGGVGYRDSIPHQTAAQTWATLELADEQRRTADTLDRIAAAQEHANVIATRALDEQRLTNLLTFYSLDTRTVDPSVRAQLGAALGIVTAATPVASVPVEHIDDFQ